MATGVPGRRQEGRLHAPYVVSYEDKSSDDEILNGPLAELKSLLAIDGTTHNRLFYGDNLPILRTLVTDPEVAGHVRLVYIDPPYSTRLAFESDTQEFAYHDDLTGAHYLEFMRQRLLLIRELLSEDASVYVHLDVNMVFPMKLVMDEVFGDNGLRSFITRTKCNPKNFTRHQYGDVADYLLFYTPGDQHIWNQPYRPWEEHAATREYAHVEEDTGRRYKKVPVYAPGRRRGATGQRWRGKLPPEGRHWIFSPGKLDEMDAAGKIVWSATGNPRRKIYLDESPGIRMSNIWTKYRDVQNQNVVWSGYPTEKHPGMLDMIVNASSNEGDLVLDAFCGSGTTLLSAERAGRRWIGIDNSISAIRTVMMRLLHGESRMGDHANRYRRSRKSSRVLGSGMELLADIDTGDPLPSAQEIDAWAVDAR